MTYKFTLSHSVEGTSVLALSPGGWREIELNLERDPKWHGVFFETGVDLQFFCNGGGREFIETVYDNHGIDTDLDILIELDCDDSGTFTELFDGKLDLATLQWDETYVTCDIVQSGILETVKNRKDIKIDLNSTTSLDGTALGAMTYAPYDLTLHSKQISAESEIDGGAFNDHHDFNNLVLSTTYRMFMCSPIPMVKNELRETIGQSPFSVVELATGSAGYTDKNASPFLDTLPDNILLPGSVTFDYDISGDFIDTVSGGTRTVGGVNNITLNLIYGQTIALANFVTLGTIAGYSSGSGTVTTAFNFNGTTNISLNPGDKCWLMWDVNGYLFTAGSATENVDIDIDYDTSELIFSIDSTNDSSTCKAFAIHEAFARIAQSITNQTDALRSTIFGRKNSDPNTYASNGCASFLAITQGYTIRKFSLTEQPFAVSLQQLYDAMDGIWNLGMGVEDGGSDQVIRVEKKSYFYDVNNVSVQLSNVNEVVRSVAEEQYINEIETGYSEFKVEDINTLDEFATKHEYATLFKTISGKISAVCSFIASGYAIEVTRRMRERPTTDWRYDKSGFVICLNRSVDGSGNPNTLDTAEKNENYTSVTGVLDAATSYNLRISPKRNLLRWIYMIAAGMFKNAGEDILYRDGEANTDMSSRMVDNNCPGDFNNVDIAENDDVQWDSANLEDGTAITIPERYEFKHKLSLAQFLQIKSNPTYAIEFSQTHNDFTKAFIETIRYSPYNGDAEFVLIKANT